MPMSDPHRTQTLSADPNRTQMGAPPTVSSESRFEATVTIKPVQCPVCKTFNPSGVMFCVDCGLIFDRALPDDAFGAPPVRLPCLTEKSGREHPLRPGDNIVGREGDVALADPRVSRRHASIRLEDGVLTLQDLGSTNGTTVNGAPLTPSQSQTLVAGDRVAFGGYELTVQLPGEANKTATLSPNQTQQLSAPPSATPAPEATLAYLESDDRRFALREGVNRFGRRQENDVCIPDPYVSGQHGTIEIVDGEAYLTDTGSTNGTLVNGAKISPHQRTRLDATDEIRLGGLVFRVRFVDGEETA